MLPRLVTLDTVQLSTSLLKTAAESNMLPMLVTLDTVQLSTSLLKVAAPLNMKGT